MSTPARQACALLGEHTMQKRQTRAGTVGFDRMRPPAVRVVQLALVCELVPALAPPLAAQPLSPRNASYTIEATLDPQARTIAGNEVIAWRNLSNRSATELQFHLYWNAWKGPRTVWMREAALGGGTAADRRRRPDDDWSRIDVTSIRLTAPVAADLTSAQRVITPDRGSAPANGSLRTEAVNGSEEDDETVMAVPLPQPVPPGGTATIEVRWTARVPRPFSRTGAIGNFFFIAQWFPKLGVLEDAGWNCHQFHSST